MNFGYLCVVLRKLMCSRTDLRAVVQTCVQLRRLACSQVHPRVPVLMSRDTCASCNCTCADHETCSGYRMWQKELCNVHGSCVSMCAWGYSTFSFPVQAEMCVDLGAPSKIVVIKFNTSLPHGVNQTSTASEQ